MCEQNDAVKQKPEIWVLVMVFWVIALCGILTGYQLFASVLFHYVGDIYIFYIKSGTHHTFIKICHNDGCLVIS